MKIVLDRSYGGFGHNASQDRTDPNLIAIVENYPADCGNLEIVEIPDNNTDYYVQERDGMEEIIYVVDGKLYFKS